MPQQVHEAVYEVAPTGTSGRMKVTAITAGLGSSGYYSPAVLEQAAKDRLIKRGTPLHLDHPTTAEGYDRPERSVQTIAGVFTSDAAYDPVKQGLVGEVQVFAPNKERLAEMAPYIGLSIRGSATDVTEGEFEGRRVPVVEGLASIDSVDFVTKAGRGGKVDMVESASPNAGLIEHITEAYGPALVAAGLSLEPVVEAKYDADQLKALLAKGQAIKNPAGDPSYPIADVADLRNAIRAVGRGGTDHDKIRAYIIRRAKALGHSDLIPDNWSADGSMSEASTQDVAFLREELADRDQTIAVQQLLIQRLTNVPASPAGRTNTEESEEDTMGKIEVDEAEHRRLTAEAGRVQALETERDTAVKERDEAVTERDELRGKEAARERRDKATGIIEAAATEAKVTFTALETKGLLADLPVDDKGVLDEAAFTETAKKAAAEAAKQAGRGTVRGFGTSHPTDDGVSLADIDKLAESVFGGVPTIKEA